MNKVDPLFFAHFELQKSCANLKLARKELHRHMASVVFANPQVLNEYKSLLEKDKILLEDIAILEKIKDNYKVA